MANYSYQSWETIDLPVVTGDTNFIIYTVATDTPGDTTTNIIYSGFLVSGYSLKNLNEILSQYIHVEDISFDPDTPTLFQDDEQIRKFYIYYTQNDWVSYTSDTITITYNWSYEPATQLKSRKIIDLLDYRQYLVYSLMSRDGSEDPISVTLGNYTIDNFTVDGDSTWTYVRNLMEEDYPGEFTFAYSYDFFVYRTGQHLDEGVTARLTIGGTVYYVTNTCYRYAIYWQNELGGYDYMLFAGKEMQTDNLSRLSYKKNYISQSLDFHVTDYLTTIGETWSLNTSWLTDEQGSKLISLFASNKVYLHDLETQKIIPVNITNSTLEHKTYKNQGRKLCAYTLEVKASQPKYRV